MDYRLFISGPATEYDSSLGRRPSDVKPEIISSAYVSPDTAIGEARKAAASREYRSPASHVVVADVRDDHPQVLYAWDGPETPAGIAAGGRPVTWERPDWWSAP